MILHSEPESWGSSQSRWTLDSLLEACPWLHLESRGGLCQLLQRLDIRHKRARAYLHSPDPDYVAKVNYLQACLWPASATAAIPNVAVWVRSIR